MNIDGIIVHEQFEVHKQTGLLASGITLAYCLVVCEQQIENKSCYRFLKKK